MFRIKAKLFLVVVTSQHILDSMSKSSVVSGTDNTQLNDTNRIVSD